MLQSFSYFLLSTCGCLLFNHHNIEWKDLTLASTTNFLLGTRMVWETANGFSLMQLKSPQQSLVSRHLWHKLLISILFCLVFHFLLIGYCSYVPTAATQVLTAFTATVLNLQNTTFHTPSLVLTILLSKTYLRYQ